MGLDLKLRTGSWETALAPAAIRSAPGLLLESKISRCSSSSLDQGQGRAECFATNRFICLGLHSPPLKWGESSPSPPALLCPGQSHYGLLLRLRTAGSRWRLKDQFITMTPIANSAGALAGSSHAPASPPASVISLIRGSPKLSLFNRCCCATYRWFNWLDAVVTAQ